MATLKDTDFPESPKPSKSSRPSEPLSSPALILRLVLIGILIIGVIVLILDRKAQSAAKSFADQITKLVDENRPMIAADVRKLAGREPTKTYDHPSGKKKFIEEYTWSGGFHKSTVYCSYQLAADGLLEAVTVNDPKH